MTYVLPNRKAFADAITRTLLLYRSKPSDDDDKNVDLCLARGSSARELLPHQKVVRDYLLQETPYRGILLYHGLGSGKTCSSIAVAESLLSTKKVFVMLPASLESNYVGELRKCGDPLYMYEQFWEQQLVNDETKVIAKRLGISDGFLDRNRKFFTTVPNRPSNWATIDTVSQKLIGLQVEDIIHQRFTFIRYNGLSSANIGKYVPAEGPNPYDGAVVIIDEVHNFISRISNSSDIARKLYDAIYNAKDCRVVALSGTPVINRPNEIAYLMNLLRGPIERIIVPVKAIPTWDEERMKTALRAVPDIDGIEFNATKKYIMLTRNPPNFRSVYNEKTERIAVQYKKDLPHTPLAADWVNTWAAKFQTDVGGAELTLDRITTEIFNCLPTDYEEFAVLFLDGLQLKNTLLFQRRIQGLVSYFKGADERMLPKRVDDEHMLEKVPMSETMFGNYLSVRFDEIRRDAQRKLNPMKAEDEEMKTFRVNSRLACDYAIPTELRTGKEEEATNEDEPPTKDAILVKIRENPDRYLTEAALANYSPKMLKMLKNVNQTLDGEKRNTQLIYSNFRNLEGLGVFSAILNANGWQEYKLQAEGSGKNKTWIEHPDMDPEKPAYGFFTGKEDMLERDLMRQIFNAKYADDFPPGLKASVESAPKKKMVLFMITAAGAEGITLANVRHVHIMEPHWNPARHDQVVGRAIRICSHVALPIEERTVRVSFYLSVFTEEQSKSTADANNVVLVRRNDTDVNRYEGKNEQVFMTTDEYLYEKTYEKDVTNKRIGLLLKQAAVDCEVHRKLHSREHPIITCMRFDTNTTGEDIAYKPDINTEELDETYLRNNIRKKRRLQKVLIKNMVFLIDPDTKEVFDGPAFDDNNRLMRLGRQISPSQIEWIEGLRIQ